MVRREKWRAHPYPITPFTCLNILLHLVSVVVVNTQCFRVFVSVRCTPDSRALVRSGSGPGRELTSRDGHYNLIQLTFEIAIARLLRMSLAIESSGNCDTHNEGRNRRALRTDTFLKMQRCPYESVRPCMAYPRYCCLTSKRTKKHQTCGGSSAVMVKVGKTAIVQ